MRRPQIPGAGRSPASAAAGVLSFALVVYYSFKAGGYFPDSPAIVAVAAIVLLVGCAAIAARPFAGMGKRAIAATLALAALTIWSLLSALWSDAAGRAVLEADRAFSYLLVLVVFASIPYRPGRMRAIAHGTALAVVVVCVAALASRLAPDLFPTAPNVVADRLSFPLTYWNALALLAAIGLVLCFALAADLGERWPIRVAAAAAAPALATTVLLTFSRGGMVAAVIGLALALALGRPRGAVPVLVSIAPPAAFALVVAYRARLLATNDPTTASAAAQGHRVAGALIAATAAAALLLYLLDKRLGRLDVRLPRLAPRARVGAAIVIAALLAAPLYQEIRHFASAPAHTTASDARARLTDPSGNGRVEYWRAALEGFEPEPLRGTGAGTYQLSWWRYRRSNARVIHAHSLYLETLSELGVVGLLLILVVVTAPIAGLARRIEGPDRVAAAALVACALIWALHAALDWDWQMPAVTAWLFAAGGAALARSARQGASRLPTFARASLAVALVCIAAAPALIVVSERHIETALAAYERGDCDRASEAAKTAEHALPLRAEPPALLAACAARADRYTIAMDDVADARRRDPGSWEYRYERALVLAVAGRDPRPEIQAALKLNPREPLLQAEASRLAGTNRRTWERRAASAPLSLDGLQYPPL